MAWGLFVGFASSVLYGDTRDGDGQTEWTLVGAIFQGDGGPGSQSVAILRKQGSQSSVAVATGREVEVGSTWRLMRIGHKAAILEDAHGNSKRLDVGSSETEVEGGLRSEGEQYKADLWFQDQFARLQWADSFSFGEIESALLE